VSTGPLASVLIAARNEERHIGECLASLARQTWSPLEIIVVDDGSRDRTAQVAARHGGVKVISAPRRGKARSINAAAREAAGEIVLFLDADMVFEPDYVERMVKPILDGTARGTAHARELVANPENRWAACWQRLAGLPPGQRLMLDGAQLAAGSVVFRAIPRAEFLRVGGFDDIGYRDDQTLAPKLGYAAAWVSDAACRHYNPETLAEVVAAGEWGAQSIAHEAGRPPWPRYLPPFIAWRALREGLRHGSLAMLVYVAASELGILRGLLRIAGSGGTQS
jgi:glycosyltransferase involved in cell wall biosynthesis